MNGSGISGKRKHTNKNCIGNNIAEIRFKLQHVQENEIRLSCPAKTDIRSSCDMLNL